MQRLEDRDEVVAPGELRIGRVPIVERHAVLHAAAREVLPGRGDRRRVEVDPVDRAPSDRRARSPCSSGPARRRRRRPERADRRRAARAHPGRREPFAAEQVLEHRPRELAPGPRAGRRRSRRTGLPRRCGTRPSTASMGRTHATTSFADRGDVVEARLVEERLVVARRQRVAALGVRRVDASRIPVIACCSSHSRT